MTAVGRWMVSFKPLSRMVFRPPWGIFDAGVYGPAASGRSLSYPLPSTIAGALAWLAYSLGTTCSRSADDFQDIECLLRNLLGDDYTLRPGFVSIDNQYYFYDGAGFVRLAGNSRARPARSVFVGVALDRRMKTSLVKGDVGLLYILESTHYVDTEIVTLVQAEKAPPKDWLAKLGGEGANAGYALVEVRELDKDILLPSTPTRTLEAILASPVLVELDHLRDKLPQGKTIKADARFLRNLGKAILVSSQPEVGKCVETIEVLEIPAGELELGIIQPGWSTIEGKPRRPHLLIPPGTRLKLRLKIDLDSKCVDILAWAGLGAHSKIGWGTLVLQPQNTEKTTHCRENS